MNTFRTWVDYRQVDQERIVRTAAADRNSFYQVHVISGGSGAIYTLAEHDTKTTLVKRFVKEGE